MFPHNELRYYGFGLHAGLTNLACNHWRLGIKKTAGKITQPINSHSRFPEYFLFDTAISDFLRIQALGRKARILDVGSPKMLGLYLARKIQSQVTLTDISELNIDEYRFMWNCLAPKAKGEALFSLQDARNLRFGDAEFDVVYSMSVIEHIEGEAGDAQAVCEMLRVLKPGGLLVLSVPFGSRFVEQVRLGFSGAVRRTGDLLPYFFQRIYDSDAFKRRVLDPATGLDQVTLTTVTRDNVWLSRGFGSLNENFRGLLGVLNPLLSMSINRCSKGMDSNFTCHYGEFHKSQDVYGDLVLSGRKKLPSI